ncbi:MAG: type II and III secretion system protein family protein [Phyllobacteriaceae bacterium]|nr:type II and III secretion system protein family protein [Phyllobacteriaceae bacterium]
MSQLERRSGVTTVDAFAKDNVITISGNRSTTVKVAKGKPQTIRTSAAFYEIVIGDPNIANVNPLTDRSFYVLGNALGTTGIALFDENKQMVGSVDIEVTLDTERLSSTIREAVPGSDIKVGSANGRVVLSGSAKDAVAADKAKKIATNFSGDEDVINSVDISSSQQVQLNVRFVEMNRDIGQELGSKLGVRYMDGVNTVSFNSAPSASTSSPAATLASALTIGKFNIDLAIKALEDKGVARRLAEPNLIARSGETASFLAGGEFPIPVAQDANKVTVEFKKYGVSLEFTPKVLENGLISLDIAPEVSSVDPSSSYNIGNISIPGFIVRRAKTSVDLKSGQSFMVAGLLQSQNDVALQRLPRVGRLPVLGSLFSSKAYQRRETDLVIIITPYLVKPVDPSKKLAEPTDGTRAPTETEYFVGNVDEVKVSDINRAKAGANSAGATSAGHFLDLPQE